MIVITNTQESEQKMISRPDKKNNHVTTTLNISLFDKYRVIL